MIPTRYGLIVPTFNSGVPWCAFLASLERQSLQPHRKLIIDSCSDDQTVSLALQAGFEVLIIDRKQFDHGGTRQQGVEALDDCDVVLFVTHEVIFAEPDSVECLLRAFDQPEVGAACGRQLPFDNATLSERHARTFNYPAQSQVKSLEDRKQSGIKTAFISNSFAAYRCEALSAVGGFHSRQIFGEDMYVGGKMLLAGWKIAYCGNAAVFQPHNHCVCTDISRSFDIGVFHSNQSWLLQEFKSPEGEGLRFVISELRLFWKERPACIFMPVIRNLLKFIAYRAGRLHRCFPMWFNRFFSLNRSFWRVK